MTPAPGNLQNIGQTGGHYQLAVVVVIRRAGNESARAPRNHALGGPAIQGQAALAKGQTREGPRTLSYLIQHPPDTVITACRFRGILVTFPSRPRQAAEIPRPKAKENPKPEGRNPKPMRPSAPGVRGAEAPTDSIMSA